MANLFFTVEIKKEELHVEIKELLTYKESIYIHTNEGDIFQVNTDDFNQKQIAIKSLQDNDLKEYFITTKWA